MVDAQKIATITAQNKKCADAWKTRDVAAIAAMYTNDAVMLPPGGSIIMGKGNIQSYLEQIFADVEGVEFQTINVAALGNDAFREIGTFQMKRVSSPAANDEEQGRSQVQNTAKYVFVWQKVDGEWKVGASIWNRMGGGGRSMGGRGRGQGQGQGQGQGRGPGGRSARQFGNE